MISELKRNLEEKRAELLRDALAMLRKGDNVEKLRVYSGRLLELEETEQAISKLESRES